MSPPRNNTRGLYMGNSQPYILVVSVKKSFCAQSAVKTLQKNYIEGTTLNEVKKQK